MSLSKKANMRKLPSFAMMKRIERNWLLKNNGKKMRKTTNRSYRNNVADVVDDDWNSVNRIAQRKQQTSQLPQLIESVVGQNEAVMKIARSIKEIVPA
jgi:predicted nucleic acid-binding Zn ribbon protein